MGGFEAWAAGNAGTVFIVCGVLALGLIFGYVFGFWRCERQAAIAAEERALDKLQAPEVAHEWDGHVGQALALTRPGQLAEEFDVDAEIARIHGWADEIVAWAQHQQWNAP